MVKSNDNLSIPNQKDPVKTGLNIKPSYFILKNENNFSDIYRLGALLSTGTNEVRICFSRETNEKKAVKIFQKTGKQRDEILTQISILRCLDHPNIVHIYEYFENPTRIHLIMEYCGGGELVSTLIKRKDLQEFDCAKYIKQVLQALSYMHENGIVHRNLRPEHILFEDQSQYAEIKIVGFGSACDIVPSMEEITSIPEYCSPDMLQKDYNELTDIWNLGIIAHLLLFGNLPTQDSESLQKFSFSQRSKNQPQDNTSENFLSKILCKASDRLSAIEALTHPWIHKSTKESQDSLNLSKVLENLSQFHYSSKFNQAVSTFIVTQCVNNQKNKELTRVFKALDKDGNGKISKEELVEYFSIEFDQEKAEMIAKKILDNLDGDENGCIDYTEFLAASIDKSELWSKENMKKAFKMMEREINESLLLDGGTNNLECRSQEEKQLWSEIMKNYKKDDEFL